MKFVLSILGFIIICTYLSSVAYTQQKKKRDLLAIPEVTRDKVICFALYTVNEKTLKLTAQFYPLNKDESREAKLEILNAGNWKTVAKTKIIYLHCALFIR